MNKFIKFVLLTFAWTAVALYLAHAVTNQGSLWLVIIAALLIAIPVLLSVLYTDTISLIHKSTKYRKDGQLKRLTTSRIFSTIFWTVWAIGLGFVTVFWFSSATQLEIASLFLSVVVLYPLHSGFIRIANAEMAAYYANATAIRWSRILVAVVMTVLFLAVTSLTESDQDVESLSKRFNEIAVISVDQQKSYLVQIASKLAAYLQEIRSYMISIAENVTPWYFLAVLISTFALFYNYCFLLSGFLIPLVEYRRVFSSLSTSDIPDPVSMSTTIFTSTVVTLFLFLFTPMVSNLELLVRDKMATTDVVVKIEERLVVLAEEIDNVLYKPGTLGKINEAKFDRFRGQFTSIAQIKKQGALAFGGMRANVDVYLDKYYSLPAEYLRILGALVGTVEKQITEDLTETLVSSPAVTELDRTIKEQLTKQPQILKTYEDRVFAILNENRIDNPEGHVVIVTSASQNPLQSPPENAILVSFNQRMTGAGVGAIGGFIAAKVVSKVAAKGAIKLAAKAITKLATSKLAGGAAGAAVGAAIGSVVPVAGTFIGSLIGFTTGIILGVSIDALLLQLEENYSRAEFKSQILNAIDEQEREFNSMLTI